MRRLPWSGVLWLHLLCSLPPWSNALTLQQPTSSVNGLLFTLQIAFMMHAIVMLSCHCFMTMRDHQCLLSPCSISTPKPQLQVINGVPRSGYFRLYKASCYLCGWKDIETNFASYKWRHPSTYQLIEPIVVSSFLELCFFVYAHRQRLSYNASCFDNASILHVVIFASEGSDRVRFDGLMVVP